MSVLAAVLAAAAVWAWPRASASVRLPTGGGSALARLGGLVHERLTARRSIRRRERETVALVRALAAELRAGAPEPAAFAAAVASAGRSAPGAPAAPAARGRASPGGLSSLLGPGAAAVARGGSLPAELRRIADEAGAGRLTSVAAVWTVAERHGSSMSILLDRLADAYDDEDAMRADLAASVAGARASMLLLAALPLGGVMLGTAVGGHPWTWLFGRPLGWTACVLAAALDAAGVIWTRWLLRERP